MLTAVKNQLKVTFLSIKYALIREMLNKTTFITNVLFMILNNASFIIQWIIIYSLTEAVGDYTFFDVILLWGIAAGTYGASHFFFENAYHLPVIINEGKLDSYLVQPKNVLIQVATANIKTSALGDLAYTYIILLIYGYTLKNFILITYFILAGGIMLTCISLILGSLSFWFKNTEGMVHTINSLLTNFATYPEGIFNGITKILLYTLIPVGVINYIPVDVIRSFDINLFIIFTAVLVSLIALTFFVFYKGLKNYSSSNLMVARY